MVAKKWCASCSIVLQADKYMDKYCVFCQQDIKRKEK
jgi:hypothetical protein